MKAWWRWTFAVPAASNPELVLEADCGVGQSGPVFFVPSYDGAETFEQHGALERLAGPFQHPDAPITHQASVGRCRVCGRAAVLLESGDSHYDFRYEVLPLRGPDADPPR